MKAEQIKAVYFVGIGGIGMSAIARYFLSRDLVVAGYDRTPSDLTEQLRKEGALVHYEDNTDLIPAPCRDKESTLVVFTPAIPTEHKELTFFREQGFEIQKRAQVLGTLTRSLKGLCVAGTHGKTTTSSMTAHLLHQSHVDCNAFLGGITKNYGTNYILSQKSPFVVIEADEFDRSFLRLKPAVSVINSIDADHLDIYGDKAHLVKSFNEFAQLTEKQLIVKEGLEIEGEGILRFGFGRGNDYRANIVRTSNGITDFVIEAEGSCTEVRLPMAGRHNVLNATAAFAAARQVGIATEDIAKALATFKGVKRRFDIRVNNGKHCYIDDYAHHPEEIRACLQAVRDAFPNKRMTLVFQPHLYSRTRDFMDEFAQILSATDELVLMDIYPARELPIEGISSAALLEKVHLTEKKLCTKAELIALIDSEKPELLVTMGAGDIDRFVEPLEKLITTW